MTIKTDKVIVENGEDFTFVCRKVPFAISCSTDLPHGDVNLVDLDLVLKMKIPLRNIRVTRMSLLGHDVRAVGRIKQTVQCVHQGRVQGTVHLEAKVVRDLYSILNVDCLASARTYERLVGRKPPDPEDEGYDSIEEIPNLDGKDEDEEHNDEVEDEAKEEKEPPDPNIPPDLKKVEDEYTKYGFKDFEDALENAPWSHACIPRETDTWRDDIAAADKGYPDTRYDHVSLAMLRQGLAKLGPTDQDQDNNRGNRFHAQFGVKSHSPHLFDRGAPQDIKKHVASSGHHPRQLRGPRSRRMVTQDEEKDEYTADELAVMHGYPPGPAGRARRMIV